LIREKSALNFHNRIFVRVVPTITLDRISAIKLCNSNKGNKQKLFKKRNPFVVHMLARGHPVHEKPHKTKRRKMKQSLKKESGDEI